MRHAVRIAELLRLYSTEYWRTCFAVLLLAVLVAACAQGNDASAKTPVAKPSPAVTEIAQPSAPQPSPTVSATPVSSASKPAPNLTNKTAIVEQGQIAFFKNCFECHDDNGKGVPGIFIRYERLSEKYITQLVRDGLLVACCQYMAPNGRISDKDLHAIVEYLRNIQPDDFTDSEN